MKKTMMAFACLCLTLFSIRSSNLLAQEIKQVTAPTSFADRSYGGIQTRDYRLQESLTSSTTRSLVMAGDYCDFLNVVAKTDPSHLYDDAISTDPEAASILRSGRPGKYHYEVIAGRENVPIAYVNKEDQVAYRDWAQDSLQSDAPLADDSLKSNMSDFEVATISTPTLTLALASTPNSHPSSSISEIVAVAGFIGLLASPELMMRMGGSDERAVANEVTGIDTTSVAEDRLTLDHFRIAAEAYPNASRFIIHEDETIHPSDVGPVTPGKHRSENMKITQALRAALQHKYSSEVAGKFFPQSTSLNFSYPSLSAAKIKDILREVSSPKKRTIAPLKSIASTPFVRESKESSQISAPEKTKEPEQPGFTSSTGIRLHLAKVEAKIADSNTALKKETLERSKAELARLIQAEAERVAKFEAEKKKAGEFNKVEVTNFKSDTEIKGREKSVTDAYLYASAQAAQANLIAQGAVSHAVAKNAEANALNNFEIQKREAERLARFEEEQNAAIRDNQEKTLLAQEAIAKATKVVEAAQEDFYQSQRVANDAWKIVITAEEENAIKTMIEKPSVLTNDEFSPKNLRAFWERKEVFEKANQVARRQKDRKVVKAIHGAVGKAEAADRRAADAQGTAQEAVDQASAALQVANDTFSAFKELEVSLLKKDQMISSTDVLPDNHVIQEVLANVSVAEENAEKAITAANAAAEEATIALTSLEKLEKHVVVLESAIAMTTAAKEDAEHRMTAFESQLNKANEVLKKNQSVLDEKLANNTKATEERINALNMKLQESHQAKKAAENQIDAFTQILQQSAEGALAPNNTNEEAYVDALQKVINKMESDAQSELDEKAVSSAKILGTHLVMMRHTIKAAEDAKKAAEQEAIAIKQRADEHIAILKKMTEEAQAASEMKAARDAKIFEEYLATMKTTIKAAEDAKKEADKARAEAKEVADNYVKEMNLALQKAAEDAKNNANRLEEHLKSIELAQKEAEAKAVDKTADANGNSRNANMAEAIQGIDTTGANRDRRLLNILRHQDIDGNVAFQAAAKAADQSLDSDGNNRADRIAHAIEKLTRNRTTLDKITFYKNQAIYAEDKAIEARATGKEKALESWTCAATVAASASDNLAKAMEARAVATAENLEKLEEAKHWEETALENQRAFEYFVKASAIYPENSCKEKEEGSGWYNESEEGRSWDKKTEEADSLYKAGLGKLRAAEQMARAIEAKAVNKPKKAQAWWEAALENQRASKQYEKAAEVLAVDTVQKRKQGNTWRSAGVAKLRAAEQLEKAIEAEAANNPALAQAWRERALESQGAFEHYVKAAEDLTADTSQKTEEAGSRYWVGTGKLRLGLQLGRAIEAESANNPTLAQAWREAAAENQKSSEYFLKALEAKAIGTPEKTNEGNSWHDAGLGKLRAAKQLEKAIEAEAANNPALAQAWREAAAESQKSSDYYAKAGEAYAIGTPEKTNKGNSWHDAGLGKLRAAE
ncbi:MAG: hypothetical protein ACH346_07025, partial [Chthoniobacterales bacterium]